ncbi:unnamed protein product [Rotaria socialis]|uniref:Uncharacterized protein n=1 Tax=Rotaria socialis TaxID=392032 RepID=A0A821F0Q5_9BILA|nr:unnamed protein product [Rotaria socialis]
MLCGHRQHASQSNDIVYAKDSLLKYEPRRLIVSRDVSDADYKKICRATISPSSQPISLYDTHLNLFDPYSDLCRPADILDFLFPPIEYIDANNHKYFIIRCKFMCTIGLKIVTLRRSLSHIDLIGYPSFIYVSLSAWEMVVKYDAIIGIGDQKQSALWFIYNRNLSSRLTNQGFFFN